MEAPELGGTANTMRVVLLIIGLSVSAWLYKNVNEWVGLSVLMAQWAWYYSDKGPFKEGK